ncbi:unnamed protein product [Ectocarpus fasciculatus]
MERPQAPSTGTVLLFVVPRLLLRGHEGGDDRYAYARRLRRHRNNDRVTVHLPWLAVDCFSRFDSRPPAFGERGKPTRVKAMGGE